MTVTTVRPDSTISGASNFTETGAASAHAALADDSDSSYIRKSGSGQKSIILGFGNYTILSTQTVKQVRLRARRSTPTSEGKVNLQLGTRVGGVNYYFPSVTVRGATTTGEVSGAWQTSAPDGSSWDQTRLDNLRCQVTEYRDTTDSGYLYELYVDVELASQPTITIDAPTGTITDTAAPDVSWTFSDTDGEGQTYYQIKVFSAAQYGAVGFSPDTSVPTWESGQIASTESTAQISTYLTSGDWRVYVRAAKTVNGLPYFSEWAYSAFTLSLTPPTIPTITLTYSEPLGMLTASLQGASSVAFTSQTFALQRSDDDGVTWVDVRNADTLEPSGSYFVETFDYEAKRGGLAYYRCRAVGYAGENVVASDWSTSSSIAVVNDGTWWIKAVDTPILNLSGVRILAGLSMKQEETLAVFRPIGRERAVVVSGTLGGADGSYRIVTVGEADWDAVYAILSYQRTLLVQAPDGSQKYVRIISRDWDEIGPVDALRREIQVQYVEVDA